MLRRLSSVTYKAPVGAQIQIVAESQDNEDFHDARFEFDLQVLDRETILGRPGCTFTFEDTARLQAFVTFQDGAPGTARYDLFEVENGVKRSLEKFVRKSQSAPQMAFTIEPEEEAAIAAAGAAPMAEPAAARARPMKGLAARKTAKKRARKAPARKTAAKAVKKKTATAKRSGGAKAKTADAKKRTTAKKSARRRPASPKRTAARKRAR
jgi:hypothetical protein